MVSVVAGTSICCVVSVAGFSMDSAVAGGFIILERLESFLVFWVLRTGFRRWLFVSVVAGKRLLMVSVVGCLMVFVVARSVCLWFLSFHFLLNGFRLLQDRGSLSDGNY